MIDKLCQWKQWKQSICVSTSELIPGVDRWIEVCSHVRFACFAAIRPFVVGFWDLSGSELFRLIARNLRERDLEEDTYSSVRTYNASDRCCCSAPPLLVCTPAPSNFSLCCSLVLTMPLSSIPTSTLYEILRPIISTRYTKFYNWSKTFSCSPLITFELSNIEECRLVFELAHREHRTVPIVGAGQRPSM